MVDNWRNPLSSLSVAINWGEIYNQHDKKKAHQS